MTGAPAPRRRVQPGRAVDDRLRDLERRFRSTRAPEDETRLLVERIRSGDLAEGRARAAAVLGHEAARVAVGAEPGDGDLPTPRWIERIEEAAGDAGAEACVRAAIAIARAVIDDQGGAPKGYLADVAIDVLERWVARPEDEELFARIADLASLGEGMAPAGSVSWACRTACVSRGEDPIGWALAACAADAAEVLGEERTRAVIRASLLPWMLETAGR